MTMTPDALKVGGKMKIGLRTWTIIGLHSVMFTNGTPDTVVLLERNKRHKTITLTGQWVYGQSTMIH